MKTILALLLVSISAHSAEVTTNLICDAREMVPGADGRVGSMAVSIRESASNGLPKAEVAARWGSDRGYIAGNGMACGFLVPEEMACSSSISRMSSDGQLYFRQSCGEPFRHFGGPYYPFDTGLTLNAALTEGQFTCTKREPGTSTLQKFLSIHLTNCR